MLSKNDSTFTSVVVKIFFIILIITGNQILKDIIIQIYSFFGKSILWQKFNSKKINENIFENYLKKI